MRGRKTKQESRADELCRALVNWGQTPTSMRPSLRALARRLATSHELLGYYLARLEKWKFKELYLRAKAQSEEIQARAQSENRALYPWEAEQIRALDRAKIRGMVGPTLLRNLEEIRQSARRGPVHPLQLKLVKLLAKNGFPGADRAVQECSKAGLKKRKAFAEIVRKTPRRQDEPFAAWIRRIWDECDKYDTKVPEVITEELLESYSADTAKDRVRNLPPIPSKNAKPFRSVEGDPGNSAKAEGRKSHAFT